PGVVFTSDYLRPPGLYWLAVEMLCSVGLVWGAARLSRGAGSGKGDEGGERKTTGGPKPTGGCDQLVLLVGAGQRDLRDLTPIDRRERRRIEVLGRLQRLAGARDEEETRAA